jgi:tRNA pseudouridine38-40 synthase
MDAMRNIALVIAYKGTNYAGWQRQQNAVSIEETIGEAIAAVTGEQVTVYGAGRTDAGVHARGQRANFKTEARMPADRFAPALNAHLPRDIRVQKSFEVPADFHSRYGAKHKTYCYRVWAAPAADPLTDDFCWHVRFPLDVDAMRRGAAPLVGTHDFKSFMASGSGAKTTVRRIDAITIAQEGRMITVTFCGTGFLYNMVRIITGTLVEMGSGRRDPESMAAILAAKDRTAAGATAPARGLVLEAVAYGAEDH